MPLQATSGAASYDGFGGGVPFTPTYIEEIFSTTLYTGNGSTQTITNGIDLTGQGGLVWTKGRNNPGYALRNALVDTARGLGNSANLYSDGAEAQGGGGVANDISAFTSSGYSFAGAPGGYQNNAGNSYVSWTFRKQQKFFDIVTWTGNGSNPRNISHNLGSTPGAIIAKNYSSSDSWYVYHRSLGGSQFLVLNGTDTATTFSTVWANTNPTSTQFTVGATLNSNGTQYVAYIFAHDAGGFGLTGTDNVVSCGSFTTDGSGNATVNLGYEPQWALIKPSNSTGDWVLVDTMRSWVVAGNNDALLYANTSDAEVTGNNFGNPTATGFTVGGLTFSNTTYIYIAIRRGPMRTPTTGTSVYNAIARTGTSATATVTGVGFPPDLAVIKDRTASTGTNWLDRLRGPNRSLRSNSTGAEFDSATDVLTSYDQNGVTLGSDTTWGLGTNTSGNAMINWFFRRAPGFFDEVCYTGNGSNSTTVTHNLSVAPELIIAKARSAASAWRVGAQFTSTTRIAGNLNSSDSLPSDSYTGTGATLWTGQPTATTFTPGLTANGSGTTYVAYLFASCPGVSKVGSYTGNGTSQTINCGFTGGARWVMIKRTDSSGDWYVWDSTRGIVAGNDPRIRIGVGAAEDTTDDSIDTNSTGFIVNQDASNINVNGGTYIFLAIA